MKEDKHEVTNGNEPKPAGTNKSNTLTLLFYVLGVFTVFAIGFLIILMRSRS